METLPGKLEDVEAGEVSCSGKEAGVVGVAGEGAGEVRDDALRLRRDEGARRRPVLVDGAELPDTSKRAGCPGNETERPAQPVDRGRVEEGANRDEHVAVVHVRAVERDGVDKLDDARG